MTYPLFQHLCAVMYTYCNVCFFYIRQRFRSISRPGVSCNKKLDKKKKCRLPPCPEVYCTSRESNTRFSTSGFFMNQFPPGLDILLGPYRIFPKICEVYPKVTFFWRYILPPLLRRKWRSLEFKNQ
jgi:hypothetical protein